MKAVLSVMYLMLLGFYQGTAWPAAQQLQQPTPPPRYDND